MADHLTGTLAELHFDDGSPAMAPTPGNRALLVQLKEINAALGLERMGELDPLKLWGGRHFLFSGQGGRIGRPRCSGERQPRAGGKADLALPDR